MIVAKDISKLLSGVPSGAWVALSQDEERFIAYAADVTEVVKKAKELGEPDPIVIRVSEDAPTLIL